MTQRFREGSDDFAVGTLVEFLQTVEQAEPRAHQILDLPVALDERRIGEERVGQARQRIGGVRLERIAPRAQLVLSRECVLPDLGVDTAEAQKAPPGGDHVGEDREFFEVARRVATVPLDREGVEEVRVLG